MAATTTTSAASRVTVATPSSSAGPPRAPGSGGHHGTRRLPQSRRRREESLTRDAVARARRPCQRKTSAVRLPARTAHCYPTGLQRCSVGDAPVLNMSQVPKKAGINTTFALEVTRYLFCRHDHDHGWQVFSISESVFSISESVLFKLSYRIIKLKWLRGNVGM